jgi:hypothetical protein
MKKSHKIILIPIQKKIEIEDICQSKISNTIGIVKDIRFINNVKSIDCCPQFLLGFYQCTPQQLLLISDEEIKIGDYWIYINPKEWNLPQEGIVKNNLSFTWFDKLWDKENYKKIIASYPQLYNLPTFSKEFIQEWCNNLVDEVEVEYEAISNESDNPITNPEGIDNFEGSELKLIPNNEVICTITKMSERVKQNASLRETSVIMYTEEEVYKLIKAQTERLTNSWISSDIEWFELNKKK